MLPQAKMQGVKRVADRCYLHTRDAPVQSYLEMCFGAVTFYYFKFIPSYPFGREA